MEKLNSVLGAEANTNTYEEQLGETYKIANN
jgi:hypothetical protein